MNSRISRFLMGISIAFLAFYLANDMKEGIDNRTRVQVNNTESLQRFEQALYNLEDTAQTWNQTFMYLAEGEVQDLTTLHHRLRLDRYLNMDRDRLGVRSLNTIRSPDGQRLPLQRICIATNDDEIRVKADRFSEVVDGVLGLASERHDIRIGQVDVDFTRRDEQGRLEVTLQPFCLLIRTNQSQEAGGF